MSAPPILAVVGSLTNDLIFKTDRVPKLGESVLGTSFATGHAGKGANMAVAAHRASHRKPTSEGQDEGEVRVFMNGAVGDDVFGPPLREGLRDKGIDVAGVVIQEGQMTGQACIVVEEGSSQSFGLAVKGANATYRPRDERIESLAGDTGVKPDLIVANLTLAKPVIEKVLETAGGSGVETVLCASPPLRLAAAVYPHVTHLVMNEHEAAELSEVSSHTELEDHGLLERVAKEFVRSGAKHVVITLGEAGAYYATQDGSHGHVAAEKGVKVEDTTGAGDTFLGAYAVDYLRQKQRGEWDIEKAISFASKAAARSIEQLGAQTAMPWLDEIERR